MRTFTKKGYGRIYVAKPEDVKAVKAMITAMDPYEVTYMPSELIAPFTEYPRVVYVHKFSDLDLDGLTAMCMAQGIFIHCFSAGFDEYPAKYTLPTSTPTAE